MLQNVLKTALHNNSSCPIHSVNQSRIANSDIKFTLINVNTQQDPMYQILKYRTLISLLMWNYNEGKDVPHIFQENQTHRCLSWNYRYITNHMYISTKILLLSSRNRVYGEVDSIKKQSKQKLEQNLSCLNTRSTWKIYRVLWFLWWTIHIIWH